MTVEGLTLLGLLVIEFRDWLAHDEVQGTVEQETCNYLLDVIAAERKRLVEGVR